jgi:hypothetical protein
VIRVCRFKTAQVSVDTVNMCIVRDTVFAFLGFFFVQFGIVAFSCCRMRNLLERLL